MDKVKSFYNQLACTAKQADLSILKVNETNVQEILNVRF